MAFIERFFRKDPERVTESDIILFVSRTIEESLNLDYKHVKAYHDFDKLSKIVSSFANSAGGLLCLGVSEEQVKTGTKVAKIFPKDITWGSPDLTREMLEDNLLTRVQPRIEGLRIVPVRKENRECIFLLDVPQSDNPPHMAYDKRYWRRLNFRIIPMEHYEVSDFFGRRRKPHLTLEIAVLEVNPDNPNGQLKIRLLVRNIGKAIAKNASMTATFENVQILNIASGIFERIDHLRKGVPAVQHSAGGGVFYAVPEYRTAIGELTMSPTEPSKPIIFHITFLAEDMDFLKYQARLDSSGLDKAKQMLQAGQEPVISLVPV